MSIFKSKQTLTEPFILRFSKTDTKRIKKQADWTDLLVNSGDERKTKNDAIRQLPEMSLAVANHFFKGLRELAVEQGTTVNFELIDILIRENGRYQGFIPVNGFSVDRQFRDFTGIVVKTIFTNPEIAAASYKEKQSWATSFIDAYRATNPNQAVIALVPSEPESEAADFKVKYVGLDVIELGDNEPSTTANQAQAEHEKTAISDSEQPTRKHEVLASQTTQSKTKKAEVTPVDTVHEKGKPRVRSGQARPSTKQSKTNAQQSERRTLTPDIERLTAADIKAPQFVVPALKPVEVTDEQYVAYQTGLKEQHSNQYLKTLEKRVNASAKETLTQLQEKQRQEIVSAIKEFKQKNDPQQGLAAEIKQTISQERQVVLKKTIKELNASRDSDIEKIKADADRAIKQRTVECEHQIQKQTSTITAEFTRKANTLSETRLKERQAKLAASLATYERDLQKQAQAAFNTMVGSLLAENQNVVGTVYQRLAKAVDEYSLEVTKVHLNAVEVKASADRAKFNLQDVERLEAQTEHLQQAKKRLTQEKTNLQQMIDRQSQELAQEKGKTNAETSREQVSKLDQLIALQLANSRSQATPTIANETKNTEAPKKQSVAKWVATGLGSLLVMTMLGGGGLWAYQNNQQVKSALSTTQSQLNQTQKAASSMDKRYSELGATNQDLKAKVGEQQSQLSKTKADSSSAAKQAQADKEAVATRTSSANKTTEKGK